MTRFAGVMVGLIASTGAVSIGSATPASAQGGRCTSAFQVAQDLVQAYADGDYATVVDISRTRRAEANKGTFTRKRLINEWGLTGAYLELISCTGPSSATVVTMNYFTDEPKTFCVRWTVNTGAYEVTREKTLRKGTC